MVRQVRCSHILVDSQQEAYDIYNQINAGANFAQMAMQRSKCPSKYKGGDLDWFGRGQMVKPFEDAAFSMNPGDMTVVQTQFGWHVIYVTGQRRSRLLETPSFTLHPLSSSSMEQPRVSDRTYMLSAWALQGSSAPCS